MNFQQHHQAPEPIYPEPLEPFCRLHFSCPVLLISSILKCLCKDFGSAGVFCLLKIFKKFINLRERERERERLTCCYTHLCIHWLTLACALTADRTHNPGASGQRSNQLNYLAKVALEDFNQIGLNTCFIPCGTSNILSKISPGSQEAQCQPKETGSYFLQLSNWCFPLSTCANASSLLGHQHNHGTQDLSLISISVVNKPANL